MDPRLARGARLVVASHNSGKVGEIEALLAPHGVVAVAAGALGLPEPAETGATFAANAQIKALAAARGVGLPALADDSGLVVEALGGAPGVYSARWAGDGGDFAAAMARVNDELAAAGARAADDRRARFVCALAIAWSDGTQSTFEGEVSGQIVWPPRGTRGFGYDPIFLPAGERLTFGEMRPQAKHAISHRARAFDKFVRAVLARRGD